jgi:hypothetical protein
MAQFLIEGNKIQTIRIVVEAKTREEALEMSKEEILSGEYELWGEEDFRPHYIN